MTLLTGLLETIEDEGPVRDIRQGVFHTAVLAKRCGLAATLPRDALRQEPPLVPEAGFLLDKSGKELAGLAASDKLLTAAIGMAALNALLPLDEEALVERNAGDILMERGEGKNVVVIGHFPFLPRLRERAANLWVLENNPHEGDFGPEKAGEYLPRADVVGMTGTAITNHTFDGLIDMCRPDAYVLLLGDSVPLSPLLFDWGVSALCGTVVDDADAVLRCLSQGGNYRQLRGVRRVTLLRP